MVVETPKSPSASSFDTDIVFRYLSVALLVLVGFVSLWMARSLVVRPFDEFATQQTCRWHGDLLERPLIESQRSNRFGLQNRTEAHCQFGSVESGGPVTTVMMEDIETGLLYTLAKAAGIAFQLIMAYGAVRTVQNLLASFEGGFDLGLLVLGALFCLVAFIAFNVTRSAVVRPLDNLVASQVCNVHGEELGRTPIDHQRAETFVLSGETDGYCQYGAGPDGEEPIKLTLEQTLPGPLYRLSKVADAFILFGASSIALRFMVDPVLDTYRWIRARLRRRSTSAT